jgi:HAD superfamily hydrolase (TIGR01549 family)
MRLQAILFDYGGTLDGAGVHWLDRFRQCYSAAGLPLAFDHFRAAFDHATRCAYADRGIAELGLAATIAFHVARQMEHLHLEDAALAAAVSTHFLELSRAALAESRRLLERLHRRVALGVISNFYGNAARILAEAGLAPFLDTIVDSTCVGLRKPDAAIFRLTVQRLGCDPRDTLYVGDSFEKDVVGAHAAGLRTGWLVGATERACRAPELVDFRLRSLAELESLIA